MKQYPHCPLCSGEIKLDISPEKPKHDFLLCPGCGEALEFVPDPRPVDVNEVKRRFRGNMRRYRFTEEHANSLIRAAEEDEVTKNESFFAVLNVKLGATLTRKRPGVGQWALGQAPGFSRAVAHSQIAKSDIPLFGPLDEKQSANLASWLNSQPKGWTSCQKCGFAEPTALIHDTCTECGTMVRCPGCKKIRAPEEKAFCTGCGCPFPNQNNRAENGMT